VERVSPALLAAVAAGRIVLAPNTELANALFDAVQRVHRDAGHAVWPTPRVHDYSSWLRERHVERQLSEAVAPRLLSEVEERELWRMVIDTAQIGRDFLDPAGAARAARRARRTLFEYAIPIEALDAAHSEECAAFLEWNRAFERRCSALGCISADSLLQGQGSPGDPGSPGVSIDWIESPEWRPAARRWLEQHGRALRPQPQVQVELSIVKAPSPDTIPRLKGAGMQIITVPYPHNWDYMLRMDIPPFNDIRVRQAANYAMNRNEMVELLAGVAVPSHGIFIPQQRWYGKHNLSRRGNIRR